MQFQLFAGARGDGFLGSIDRRQAYDPLNECNRDLSPTTWVRARKGNHGVCIPTRNHKLDEHRGFHLDRRLVEEVRFVLPLLDCVDRSRDKQGMPGHWLNRCYIPVLVNVDTEKDSAVYVLPLCLGRIARVHLRDEETSHHALSNTYMRRAGDTG